MMGTRPLVPSPKIAGLKSFYKRSFQLRKVTSFYSESEDWTLPTEVIHRPSSCFQNEMYRNQLTKTFLCHRLKRKHQKFPLGMHVLF